MNDDESRLMRWKSLALLGALCLTGAAFTLWQLLPEPIAKSATKQVSSGMSRDQVRQILGDPEECPRSSDGTTAWVYYFDYLGLGGYVVRFDRDGVVQSAGAF